MKSPFDEIDVPTNSVATVGRVRVLVVHLEVVDERRVPVARDHDRVRDLGVGDVLEDAGALPGPAVPGVVPEAAAVGVVLQLAHHHSLGDHVPAGARALEVVQQPLLLRGARHGGVRVEAGVAGRLLAVAAGIVRAVLARVEDVEVGDVPVAEAPVEPHLALPRLRAERHRHVLEVRLVAGRPALQELRARVRELRIDARVVVGDLVVVPGDHPREQPVGLLEVRIRLVERVLKAVAIERHALLARTCAAAWRFAPHPSRLRTRRCSRPRWIDEVDVLLGHAAVRRVEPVVPLLAGRERERELRRRAPRRRARSSCARPDSRRCS